MALVAPYSKARSA